MCNEVSYEIKREPQGLRPREIGFAFHRAGRINRIDRIFII